MDRFYESLYNANPNHAWFVDELPREAFGDQLAGALVKRGRFKSGSKLHALSKRFAQFGCGWMALGSLDLSVELAVGTRLALLTKHYFSNFGPVLC